MKEKTNELKSKFEALRETLKDVNENATFSVISDTLDLLSDIVEAATEKEHEHEKLDKMEVEALNAVENIMSYLHCEDAEDSEKELLLDAIHALIELGYKYE